MEPILYAAAAVLAITAVINLAARRLHLPSPVLLVVAGIVLAVVPGLPRIALPPNLVLLVFLPPIIYYSAFGMSWQAFCKNLRPITALAVGCVVFTTVTVAAAAHWLIGLSWPIAFVLGAIVSPPDVVAPLAIARRLGIPSRITVILEGEGLVNDATALVLFKFALAAALTGAFSITGAAMSFVAIVVAETLFGLVVGWTVLRLRHMAREPLIEVTLSLLTPFLAFWVPHALGGSGVLATVVAGLYVGAKGVELIRSNTRLQALFFWDFVTYLIEGAIFLLTGLQARTVIDGLQGMSWTQLLFYGVAISLVAIVVRFVWVFPAAYLPQYFSARLRQRDPPPPWQYPFMISFTGVRGVVSLAAALSIPLMMSPTTAVCRARSGSVSDLYRDPRHSGAARPDVAVAGTKAWAGRARQRRKARARRAGVAHPHRGSARGPARARPHDSTQRTDTESVLVRCCSCTKTGSATSSGEATSAATAASSRSSSSRSN